MLEFSFLLKAMNYLRKTEQALTLTLALQEFVFSVLVTAPRSVEQGGCVGLLDARLCGMSLCGFSWWADTSGLIISCKCILKTLVEVF